MDDFHHPVDTPSLLMVHKAPYGLSHSCGNDPHLEGIGEDKRNIDRK